MRGLEKRRGNSGGRRLLSGGEVSLCNMCLDDVAKGACGDDMMMIEQQRWWRLKHFRDAAASDATAGRDSGLPPILWIDHLSHSESR